MININLWMASTYLVTGAILLIVQYSVFQLFRTGYEITRSKQLRLITLSFLLFITATISMLGINIWVSIINPDIPIQELDYYRRLSVLVYNSLFSLGLFILLLSTSERLVEERLETLQAEMLLIPILQTGLGVLSRDLLDTGILITNIVILLQGTFLLSQYILYSEKGVITGKLWTLGLVLIIFSRGVDILPEKPFSELLIFLTDAVAFLLLYLMKKEAEIRVKG